MIGLASIGSLLIVKLSQSDLCMHLSQMLFFFMLSSAEHEILNAHKYIDIKKSQLFSGSDKPRLLFFLLINIKMPKIVGILTFMRRKNFMLSRFIVYSSLFEQAFWT